MSKPRLLYCSPVLPATTGNGLAMRAGTVLRALADRYRVTLLVTPRYRSPAAALPDEIASCCQQVMVADNDATIPVPRARDHRSVGSGLLARWRRAATPAGAVFDDEPFDVVHVFRLATVESVRPWLDRQGNRPARHLDLDDVESVTRHRIAERYEQTDHPELARAEREAADRAHLAEARALLDFDRVYVCSSGDRDVLEARRRPEAVAEIQVLPNAVLAPNPVPPWPDFGPFTFLFIGTLGYFPNEDAVITFCRDILPPLRSMATRPFRIAIAGIGATPEVLALAALPNIDVIGAVADVAVAYRQAHAVVVPIQSGGGTRIKILEAFAYRRPVVTTQIGVEGINAVHGRHLLVADQPVAFAEQCARLMTGPVLANRLAAEAETLHGTRYSLDALRHLVRALPPA
jgi:polysaccharide biosynthesis protein PslH